VSESFSADWLALREAADHRARADDLTLAIGTRLAARAETGLRAVDLAAGTGSNVRHLLSRLPAVAHWTLVDHDAALLAQAWRLLTPLVLPLGRSFDVRRGDLNEVAALPLDGCALVTASALLDLVSADWLRAFARRCREVGADVLCALSYDGRIECAPAHPLDERVRELVNRHQRTDKGFGPALGPDAARTATDAFRDEGYEVQTAESDWVLDASRAHDAELIAQLVDGWAGAAVAMAPAESTAIEDWRTTRVHQARAGALRCRVGHVDLSAAG
jgi:hypothetical protein